MIKTSRKFKPIVILKRLPSAGELEFLRRYMIQYKANHPGARGKELRVAAQRKYDSKIITTPFNKLKAKIG